MHKIDTMKNDNKKFKNLFTIFKPFKFLSMVNVIYNNIKCWSLVNPKNKWNIQCQPESINLARRQQILTSYLPYQIRLTLIVRRVPTLFQMAISPWKGSLGSKFLNFTWFIISFPKIQFIFHFSQCFLVI